MKKRYVRTEDGIFEVVKEEVLCGVRFYDIETKEHLNRIRGESIIAYADIEELCDEFVLVEKMREATYYHRSHNFNDFKSIAMLNERYTLYGAVWTSKGLIYVAKMNKDGELELI